MALVDVDIADLRISDKPGDMLITYSLGSCIGVTVFDPVVRVGGMIHCMLPLAKVDREKSLERPAMFVDTGMHMLLYNLFEMGVRKANAVVNVAGGAHVLDNQGLFKIGERNMTVLRKILWKNGMLLHVKEVGGKVSRTIKLDIGTGDFFVKSRGQEICYGIPGKNRQSSQ